MPFRSGPILAPIVGVLYGVFVEWDDGGAKKDAAKKPDGDAPKPPQKGA